MTVVPLNDIPLLLRRLQTDGVCVDVLPDWPALGIAALFLGTGSGARYLIEPILHEPSLVTRFSEATPFFGDYRLPTTEAIVRREGNPDRNLRVGCPVNILGLCKRIPAFDPDSIYTIPQLIEIRYLPSQKLP